MSSIESSDNIKIAVIMPTFKQPALLVEALESALSQECSIPSAIVVVNDGCPFNSTHMVCLNYAENYPGKILYLPKANGGLSSARNAGIELALQIFPKLEALYFMDSDNRISSLLLEKMYRALMAASPETGWAYPDIDKFGIHEFCDTSGEYLVLEHLFRNICEAGSMIHRKVLDAGCRFDENMKLGYEDWEFWLQCIEKGFKGAHIKASGFNYRLRGESMVSNSQRNHEIIMNYIYTKHSRLFSIQNFARLESEYRNRYALVDVLSGTFTSTYTPSDTSSGISIDDYLAGFNRTSLMPNFGKFPPYTVFISNELRERLKALKLLDGIVWAMEYAMRSCSWCAVNLVVTEGGSSPKCAEEILSSPEMDNFSADLVMVDNSKWYQNILAHDVEIPFGQQTVLSKEREGVLYTVGVATESGYALIGTNQWGQFKATHQHLKSEIRNRSDYALDITQHDLHRAQFSMPRLYMNPVFQINSQVPLHPENREKRIIIFSGDGDGNSLESIVTKIPDDYEVWLVTCAKNGAFRLTSSIKEKCSGIIPYLLGNDGESNRRPYFGSNTKLVTSWGEEWLIGTIAGFGKVITLNAPEIAVAISRAKKFGSSTFCFIASQEMVADAMAFEYGYDFYIIQDKSIESLALANGIPAEKIVEFSL